ncbi:MAG: DUF2269 family protein [Deltaproteobacteria bacterium]|nr:DUF2269 family protein [Deltaproteobacteria bacterium]
MTLQVLRFAHVMALIVWLGCAAGEIVMELVLWRTKSAARQRAYIDLHRIVDLTVEGPALLLTLVTGTLLLWQRGYLSDTKLWPRWLEDKIICGLVVAAINIVCGFFVMVRARKTDNLPGNAAPLSDSTIQSWHYAVISTFIGVPFAMIALWLAVNKS